jgi:2-oxoglutarate dehydrogenase E2 component (dihydrolipoamide succinyltransferase)
MPEKVIMPQLGESVVEGTLIKWLVKEGEHVEEFDSLMEVESAKVNTEIPSPATGTLLKILVEEGNTVKAGTILGWIGDPEEKIPTGDGNYVEEVSSETTQPIQTQSEVVASKQDIGRNRDLGFISPVVARLARENNIDLSLIQGTGNNNRITKKDVLQFIEKSGGSEVDSETAAWETPGEGDLFRPTELQFPDRFKSTQPAVGKIEEKVSPTKVQTPVSSGDQIIPLTKMRKAIADHMVMSKHTSPHVTTVMEADMKLVSNHLKINKELFSRQGIRLTFSSYFVAATALALRAYPLVNSTWTDNGILVKNAINIGLATSLEEEGLIVPVIKNADGYSISGLARVIGDLVNRARSHQLKPDDVTGGTFSITNHGTAGSLFATPVINQPQAGILGVGAIKKRVVVINDAIAIRPMVYLSFTFDHRILDGSTADNFLAIIVSVLENWQ